MKLGKIGKADKEKIVIGFITIQNGKTLMMG